MRDKFILWAFALDNTSPDHFEVRGRVLDAADTSQRQEAVSFVSSVVRREKWTFKERGMRLTADGSHFLLEVPSEQRDSAGRTAPIVCCGDYEATICEALGASTAVALNDFAKRIGRTLSPAHLDLVPVFFDNLKKKSSTKKLLRALLMGIAGFLLLSLLYWVRQKAGG